MSDTKVLILSEVAASQAPDRPADTDTQEVKPKLYDPANPFTKKAVYFLAVIATLAALTWGLNTLLGTNVLHETWYQIILGAAIVIYMTRWAQERIEINSVIVACFWIIIVAAVMLVINTVKPGTNLKTFSTMISSKTGNSNGKKLARKVDYKIYPKGTYVFSLKAGEVTKEWITFPNGILIHLDSKDRKYKLLYPDGGEKSAWLLKKLPNKYKFKLLAVTDQPKIVMRVF